MSDLGTHGVTDSLPMNVSTHNAPAVHEDNALFFTHPSAPGVTEPQEDGGGTSHSNEPPVLRHHQVSSECLSGLKSGFPVACQTPHVDSYSPSLNLILYYKKKAKASPCVTASTKITSLLSSSMPSAHTELQPARKEVSHRWH